MADYQEGHILSNKKTGDRVQLQDGQWVSIGPTVGTDISRSTVPEIVRGATNTATLPRSLSNLGARGVAYATEKLGYPEAADTMRGRIDKKVGGSPLFAIDPSVAMNLVEKGLGGEEGMYTPKTTPGKYYGAVMQAVPSMAGGGAGTVASTARNAAKTVTGALGGEAAGQASEDSKLAPLWRVLGTLAGSTAPSAGRRMWTPNPATPERLAQAANVERTIAPYGARLGAGQVVDNPLLTSKEEVRRNVLPRTAGYSDQAQNEAVSRALMESTGATPGSLPYRRAVEQQQRALGTQREAHAAGVDIPWAGQFRTDLNAAADRARASLRQAPGTPVPGISDLRDVMFRDPAGTGRIRNNMTGPEYLEWRTRLRENAEAAPQGAMRTAHYDARNALDAAAERAAPGFNVLHERMANARALGHAMPANGVDTGVVTPGAFYGAHSVPTSPTAQFASNAATVLQPPNLGALEAARSHAAGSLPALVGGAAGAGAAHYFGHGAPVFGLHDPSIFGLLAGNYLGNKLGASSAYGNLMMSDPVQRYLRNQAVHPGNDPTGKAARMAKILAGSTPLREGLEGSE